MKRSLFDERLLEDCRHVMLCLPPKIFDEIAEISPAWRHVLDRLNKALSKTAPANQEQPASAQQTLAGSEASTQICDQYKTGSSCSKGFRTGCDFCVLGYVSGRKLQQA